MKTTLTATKAKEKIEAVFAKAVQENNFDKLKELLDDSGEYQISIDKKTVYVNKNEFINWMVQQRKEFEQLTYHFDNCTFCEIGQPVVIFNDGAFPKVHKSPSEREKMGFMIEVKNDMISHIKICHSFLQTDNKCLLDVITERVKAYEKEHGKTSDKRYIDKIMDDTLNTPEDLRRDRKG